MSIIIILHSRSLEPPGYDNIYLCVIDWGLKELSKVLVSCRGLNELHSNNQSGSWGSEVSGCGSPTYELTEALKITDSINDSRSQHQIRQSVARVSFHMLQITLNSRSLSMENFRVCK